MTSIVTHKSLQPQSLEEAIKFSDILSKSQMVPKDYQGKPANVLVAVQWGMELGLQPLQALQNIAVINGRPSVWGDAMLAMVRADARCVSVNEYQEGDADERTAVCTIKRKHAGEIEEITRTFSVAQAKLAGLWGKGGAWKQYPERMLQHRARGNALRDGFPDVLAGLKTTEEVRDEEEMKNITPAAVAPPTLEDLQKPKPEEIVSADLVFYTMDDEGRFDVKSTIDSPDNFHSAYQSEIYRLAEFSNVAPTVKLNKIDELKQANISTLRELPTEITKALAKIHEQVKEVLKGNKK